VIDLDNKVKIIPPQENNYNAGNCEMAVAEGGSHILIVDDDEGISLTLSDMCCIMITGQESSQTETEAFKAGAYAFLTKPFEMDELLSTIKKAIAP